MSKSLTAEYVRSILDYDEISGCLTWRERTPDMFDCQNPERVCEVYNRDFAGKVAGTLNGGYLNVYIAGKKYRAHRIIWLIVHGNWPANQIDHINGSGIDNRLVNLRDVSNKINSWNVDVSKHTGVVWDKEKQKWKARIRHEGKRINLGRYKDREAAITAYHECLYSLRGEFVRNSPVAMAQ